MILKKKLTNLGTFLSNYARLIENMIRCWKFFSPAVAMAMVAMWFHRKLDDLSSALYST